MNKDGKITFIELKVGLRKMEKDFLVQMFDIFDGNGDGLPTIEKYIRSFIDFKVATHTYLI